ncbi:MULTISPECIES: hypothetical protein [unclassified Comamonas]|uniref:hypothetical protein n=1 Tax=unclassified Comamonas TaxID=2638500 RepID=UPI001FA796F8|nr:MULTISPECIES: hypothetical protein [unclassified Comamonas]UNV89387.1 hypothetical protein MP576_17485 [Comamonas sp. 7D-2evo1]UNV97315.1 hypothetical protein MPZ60_08920 [Comamonas sp. 7D-2]UNV99031.1 hypothetical protein MP579_17490 [Comamonas sp. 7D-2evo2]
MHVNKKKPNEVKSNFLSHAETRGVSMQRSPIASIGELVNCISKVAAGDDRCWLGYVELSAENIRSIRSEDGSQMYCVADAANEENPAHAEIHMSSDMPDADRLEYRAKLTKKFGKIKGRKALYDGKVWDAMPEEIKAKETPERFIED